MRREVKKGLVIIPTYNEIENIEAIVKEVLSVSPILDVLIVDDNSTDGTKEKIMEMEETNPRVFAIHRPKKMGLGSAYVEGFKYAIQRDYDVVFEMDADFSHNPQDIPRFLEAIKDVDEVVGSRYKSGVSVVNWPMSRLLLSWLANVYAKWVTGVPVADLTGGFKCYRREVLETVDLSKITADGYGFQIEITFWAYIHGFKIVEIPIVFVDRRSGQSKMSKSIIWEAFWVVWKLGFTHLWYWITGRVGKR